MTEPELDRVDGAAVIGLLDTRKVSVKIHRRFFCFVQVEYIEGTRWAHPGPYIWRHKVKWVPTWRLLND